MTQTLLAEDYKIAPTRLRETLEWVTDMGTHPVSRSREGEHNSEPAAIPQSETSAATEGRSRLSSLYAKLVKWLKGCAEAYAAAAAYENLSRLSDAELRRRGLSRDVLARDLMKSWLG